MMNFNVPQFKDYWSICFANKIPNLKYDLEKGKKLFLKNKQYSRKLSPFFRDHRQKRNQIFSSSLY
jgi:hypothetical protein